MTPDEEGRLLEDAAAIVAGWPQVWRRLLDAHVVGPDGRCVACPRGTVGAPRWPCGLAGLAGRARRVHAARQPDQAVHPIQARKR